MLAVPYGAGRRQLATTAGPAAAWAVLLVVTALDGGAAHAASGGVLAATLPLLALLGALVVVVQGSWPFPRLPRALWLALGCFALWTAASFASMAWSLSAAASWTDGVRGLSALAAVAGGAWLGAVLRRPLEAACIALVAAAWPILGWAVVQRSFGSFDRYQATTRLSQPFGYPNAVGIFSVIVALVALWLVTRRPLAARAVGGATLALTFFVLPMTGSRGSLIALALGVVLFAWLQPRRVECAAALVAILIVAVPAAVWTLSLSALNVTLSGLQPSAGPALLLAGIAVVVAGAALAVLAVGAVERLGTRAYARAERRTWQAAIGVVVLGAIGFMALHGGPIGAGRNLWDGLTGGGGVNNGGGRYASLSSNMRSRWWKEAFHAFQDRPWHGWGAGTFSLVDALRRPDPTPAGETHNAGLHVLSGLGLLGAIPALGALVASFWAAIAGFRRLTGESRAAGAGLLAALAAFALHNQLDWDWSFLTLTLAVYPLVGLLATAGTRTDEPPVTGRARRLQAAIALPVLGLAAVIALLPYLSERAVQRAESLDSRAGEAADSGNALGAATMRESALVELDLARGFEPVSYTALLDQANVQVELGRTADALATLKRAIRLEPYTTDAWLQRAQIEQDLGQKEKACATLLYTYSISGYFRGVQNAAAEAGCPIA